MKYFPLILLVLLMSCAKKNTVVIPIHEESYNWVNQIFPAIYTNQVGDTLLIETATESTFWLSDIADIAPNSGTFDYQYFQQNISIDSTFSFKTNLNANINQPNYIRQDVVGFTLYNAGNPLIALNGQAALAFTLNPPTDPNTVLTYQDSVFINNKKYYAVYRADYLGLPKTSFFVSPNGGLIGFAIETDTFNLRN